MHSGGGGEGLERLFVWGAGGGGERLFETILHAHVGVGSAASLDHVQRRKEERTKEGVRNERTGVGGACLKRSK